MDVFFGHNQTQTLQSVTTTSLCTRLIDIASTSAGTQATLTDASGTNSLDYVSLKDIKAQGGASWNASNVVNNGNNTGWTITVAPSVTYYWIGGTGNWNDGAHWSVSSGGAAAGCSPNPQDDVVFDNNSFSASGQTVTLVANASCRSMTWTTGVTQNPTFTGSYVMDVNGDLKVLGTMTWVQNNELYPRGDFILNENVTWNHAHYLLFYSDSTNNIVNTAGKTLLHAVAFDAKTTGSAPKWTLGNNYKLQNGSDQYLTYVHEGTWETAGYDVDAGYEFRADFGNDVRTINLTGTDTLRMRNAWRIHSSVNTTLTIGTTTILLLQSDGDNFFVGGNRTYRDVVVRNTSTNNRTVQFTGNNNIRDVYIRIPYTGFSYKLVHFENSSVFRNIDISYSGTNDLYVYFKHGPHTVNNVNINFSSTGTPNIYFQDNGHQFNNFNVQVVSGYPKFYFQSANNQFQDFVISSTGTVATYLQMEQNQSFNKLDLPNGFDMLIYAGRTQTIGNFIPRSTCLSRSKIRGQNATTSKISQAIGTVNTEWITLENHTVQGGATFNATDVTQVGSITGWNAVAVQPITLFWVGGTGNWNDSNHWAFVTGGPGNGCLIPTSVDHAVFDANSFTAVSQTVTMNIAGQCKNMIWNNVAFAPTFYQNGNSQDLTVYGDLVVNSTMTWNWTNSGNSILYLKGSTTIASSVTWNHNKEVRFEPLAGNYTINMGGKTFLNNVRFNGAATAKWNLLNDLTINNGFTTFLNQGELYSNGYAVDFGLAFDFNNSNTKKLDFTGTATVKVRRDWLGSGTGTTLVAGGALILLESSANENLTFTGGSIATYGDVTVRHLHANNLTVTINGNNTFEDINFEYTNRKDVTINGNNTFGSFTLVQDYSITSNIPQHSITGINTFGTFVILSLGVQGPEIAFAQNNTYGNLISAGRGTRLKFGNGKTQTINGEILVLGTGGQPIFFNSTTAGAQATISKASGNVCLDFVWIKDINATGGATFNAGINGANLGNNTGINFSSACAAYYWIGGSGNWSDLNHWATSSGGSTLHLQLPTEIDDVYFDANSFTASGQTVTFNDPNAECRNMNWFSALYQPTLAGTTTGIDIYGSLVLTPFMNQNWNGTWNFTAQSGQPTIDAKGKTLQNLTVNTLTGSIPVLLINSLKIANDLTLTRGNFQTQGHNIDTKNFNIIGTESRTLQLGSSVVTVLDGKWDVQDATNLTINPGTSKIVVRSNGGSSHFYGGSKTYNNANIYTTTTMNSTMTGSNTFNQLKAEPGVTLSLQAGSTQTTTSLLVSGTCSKSLTIQSTVPGTQANFSQASGTVNANFLSLIDNNATGGATFNATQATDNGNNLGWNFITVPALQVSVAVTNATCPTPNNGVANAVAVGGTTPYTYLWNTIETTQTLNNLSAGTYSVTVSDGAGCVASASGTVNQPASYNFTATATGSMVCYGLTNGTASVSLGGTAQLPASYLWSNAATTATPTNLAPATYSVTVTDAANCKAIRSAVVGERPDINTILSINNGKCLNAPISFNSSGTGSGLQYAWDFGDSGTANVQNPSYTYVAPNNYTVQLTITDENNCSDVASQALTITAPPALAAVTAANASCLNICDGAVTLTPSNGLLPYSMGNFEFIHNFDGTVFNTSVFSRDNVATYSQNNALSATHATASWNKYVYTNQTFARAAGKEFTFSYYHPSSTNSMIGWHGNSTGNSNRYVDLLYAFYFNGNSTLNIFEDGSDRGNFTAQVPGGYTTDTWYEGKIVLKSTGADYYLRKQGDINYALIYSSSYSTETNLRAGFTYLNSGTAITDNWKVGYSNPATANVCPGTYQYVVTDANLCTASASSTVSVGDATPPTVNCPINQTVNLSAGNCNAAVTVAAPTFSDNCSILGNVLDFDGTNDYITIPGSFNSNFSSNRITIEGWVYNASGYTPNNCMLAGESYLGDGNIRFAVHLQGGNIYAGTYPTNLTGVSAPLATNTWVHFAGTYDGTLIRLFLNGTQVASAAVASLPNGNEEWRIGRRWDSADYFKGKLDEVRIWNVARTATEINANKNQTISPQTGLVGYYRFNQGVSGGNNTAITQATDASGNSYNGTLQNFTLNSATSNFVLDNPNVSAAVPVNSFNSTSNASGTYPLGTNTVTWSLTDQNSNIGTCVHTITVLEPTPPTLSCPANQTVMLDILNQAILPNYSGLATAGDNCPGAVQLVQAPASGSTLTGTTPVTVTFTATDVSGNTATCTFDVTGVIISMSVEGGASIPIIDGDTSPDPSDHTQFGNVNVGSNLVRNFTIQNTGTAALNISSINADNGLFTVGALTPASPIPVSDSASFTVTFAPTATGEQNDTISINWDGGVYDFSIQGTGTCSNTCLNGATQNNDCSCNCLTGYTGVNCQIATYIFYGYTNTDWSTASNWNTGVVPTTALLTNGDAVIVAANCVMPAVNIAFPSGTTFTVNSGVSLSADLNAYITINSGAVFTINGSLSQGRVTNTGIMDIYGSYAAFYMTNNSGGAMNVKTGASYSCPACAESMQSGSFVNNDGTLHVGTPSTWNCTLTNNATGSVTDNGLGTQITIGSSGIVHNYGYYLSRISSVTGIFNNYSSGTLTMPSSCNFTINSGGQFFNSGNITIPVGDQFNINAGGTLTNNSSGTITNNGSMPVNLTALVTNNGTYKGNGSFSSNLFTNQATGFVIPGSSPGCLSFGSGFTNSGTLNIEAAGTTPCTGHDQLNVTGTATLSGTLALTISFTPVVLTTLTIINADVLSGTFTTVTGLATNWSVNYNTGAGNVELVYTPPVPATALHLNGAAPSDNVNSPSITAFGTQPVTIEFWAKNESSFCFPVGFANSYLFMFSSGNFVIRKDFAGDYNTGATVSNTGTVWEHFALTYDGINTFRAYKNGVPTPTPSFTGFSGSAATGTLQVGEPKGGYPYTGAIDEVRMWSELRSDAQILANYNTELTDMTPCLQVYWKFNQGYIGANNSAVTSAYDNAYAVNHGGTLTNFALTGSTGNWVAGSGITDVVSEYINAPEADLEGSGNGIADGDPSPTPTDHTDFGNVPLSLSRTFTVENNGTATLNISGVTITGTNAADFVVTTPPAATVAIGDFTTFTILFTPSSIGLKTAVMHIYNDDCDEGDYNVAIQGTGSCVAPAFSACPTPITANTASGQCTAVVSYTVTPTGNPTPTVTYTFTGVTTASGSGTGSGSTFNKGVTNVTVTATNACGTATCSFTVTVTDNQTVADNQAPTLASPGNPSINVIAGTCAANYTIADPISDNCTGSTWGYSTTGATILSSSGNTIADGTGSGVLSFNKGVTTVTLTGNDGTNNATTVSFTVTVVDNEPPVITCAAPVTINNTPGLCTGTTTLTGPTVTDNCPDVLGTGNAIKCDGSNDYIQSTPLSLGTNDFTVEFLVKAGALSGFPVLFAQDQSGVGNPAFRLEVTSGSNVLLFVMADASYSAIYSTTTPLVVGTWTHIAVVRSGNTYTTYMNGVAAGTATVAGSINQSANTFNFRIGSRRNASNTAQDPFNGTFDEFRVWNVARTPVQLLSNMNIELVGSESGLIRYYKFNQGTAGSPNAGLTTVTATTGVNATLFNFALNGVNSNWVQGIPTIASFTVTNNAPTTYPKGNTTVVWTATDAAGKTATCGQTVTVVDNEAPTISCPVNQGVNAILNTCAGTFTIADPVNDNCSGATYGYTLSGATTDTATGIPDGSGSGPISFNIGTTTITLIGTDASNNTASCSFTLTVYDNQPPTVTCPAATTTINTNAGASCEITIPDYVALLSPTDNCTASGSIVEAQTIPSGAYGVSGDGSTVIVSYTATDTATSPNTITCTVTITVNDDDAPTVTCPATTATINTNAGASCQITIPNYVTTLNSTDNCTASGSIVEAQTIPAGAYNVSGDGSTVVVNYTATDAASPANTTTCTVTITVNDDDAPTFTCPTPTLVLNTTGNNGCEVTIPDLVAMVSDAADNCGLAAVPVTQSIAAGTYSGASDSNTIPVTVTVTDAASPANTTTCSYTFTVNDDDAPTFTCPTPTLVLNTTGNNGCEVIIPNLVAMVSDAADNCGLAAVPVTQSIAAGTYSGASDSNTIPVTVTVTDAASPANTTTCSYTFTVNDDDAPTFTCPTPTLVLNTTGNNGCEVIIPNLVAMVSDAADNCSLAAVPVTQSIAAGTYSGASDSNTIPVTVTVTDSATPANTTTCSYTFTVNDDDAPTFTCPTPVLILNTTGNNGCEVTIPNLVAMVSNAADNCGLAAVPVTQSIAAGAYGGVSDGNTIPVTITVTDAATPANITTCTVTFTVNDDDAPTVTCPAATTTINTNAGASCEITIPDYVAMLNPTDNCSSIIAETQTIAAGAYTTGVYHGAIITMSYTATDDANPTNSTTCTVAITVNDDDAPTLANPGNQVMNIIPNTCAANYTIIDPITDNCVATWGYSYTGATFGSGSGIADGSNSNVISFNKGLTNVTLNGIDEGSNTAVTVSFTVTVIDNQIPTLTCPSNQTPTMLPNACLATYTFADPIYDNCPGVTWGFALTGATVSSNSGISDGASINNVSFNPGITTVTFSGIDASSNLATTCSFTVTVTDNQPPTFTCPTPPLVLNTTGNNNCEVLIPNLVAMVSPSDNCGLATVPVVQSVAAGAYTGVSHGSTIPVTLTVTDASSNTAGCTVTFTVNDYDAPVLTCPNNIVQGNTLNTCQAAVTFTLPTPTDNCTGATLLSSHASGSTFNVGTTTVTLTATDGVDNSTSCSFTVTVNDTQPPVAVCPSNITQPASSGQCSAAVSFTVPPASDNCTGNPLEFALTPSGSNFNVGTTTVQVIASDASSNTGTCSFTVTITDNQPPVANCPPNITQTLGTGVCNTAVNFTLPTANDNCGATSVAVPASGSTFNLGTSTVTVTATDAANHTSSCSFTVTLNGTQPPTANCPLNITQPVNVGQCFATVNYILPAPSDDCGATSVAVPASGSGFNIGTTTVLVTATDAAGNTGTCSFTVTVPNPVTPLINGTPNGCGIVTLMASGGSSYLWSGGNTPNQALNSFTTTGTYSVTVTNGSGCTNTASVAVTVTPVTNNTTSVTACNSYTWAVNGLTYNATGSYNYMTGCHTETLNLTINSGSNASNTTYMFACVSYTWPVNGQTYTATGIYTYTFGCQTEILNLTINEGNTTVGNVSGITSSICEGETISTTADGGTDYQWSGPNGYTASGYLLNRPNATMDMSGLYTVTISAGNGCGETIITTLITVNPKPVASITGVNNICIGNTLSLTATGGATYLWSGPGGYTNNASTITRTNATVLMSGTYHVTVTNVNGCIGTASMAVLVNPAPVITISGATSVCTGSIINLTATGGATYQWAGPGGFTASGATMTRTATAGTGGTYSVTATDANGCSAIKAVTVTVATSSVSASITGTQTYCAGTTITLTASGGATYQWNGPGGFTATGNVLSIPNATPAMAGTYVVTVTNAGGCTASNSKVITVYALPNAAITGNANICVGSTLILSASGGTSYAWSGPGFSATTANISRANATVAMSGTYTVTVTGTGGCKSTASVIVVVNAKPVVTVTGATSVCSGTTITFTATGGGSYAWSGPGGFTANTATMERPSATTAMNGQYKVTVTNAAGCTTTASKSVTVIASPNAVISGVSTVCMGANFSQTASGGTSYAWSFPDGPTASSATFTRVGATLPMGGTYNVTVTGSNGCKSTASKVIAVNNCTSKTSDDATETVLSAYPNPSDGLTTIAFTATATEEVSLSVFNVEGKEVAVLFNGTTEAHTLYEFEIDMSLLTPGTYYAVLHPANGQVQQIRMMVVR